MARYNQIREYEDGNLSFEKLMISFFGINHGVSQIIVDMQYDMFQEIEKVKKTINDLKDKLDNGK